MGGGPRIPYPKYVYSPTGGWYPNPKNWKRNTVIAGLICAAVSAFAFSISAEHEYRPIPPPRWIPSQIWASKGFGKDAPTAENS